MHRLETSHNLQQPVPVSVLATGRDVTTCSRLCFSPARRLGAVAVTLEKASKTGTRLLSLTPGVCPTFHLHPRATETLGRTCSPQGHMPAEYLMCAAHRELEKKSEGLTPAPGDSRRPTGVQGHPGRSVHWHSRR